MATLNTIEQILQRKLQAALTTLPVQLGNEAVNWFKGNFRRQGWPGNGLQPWKPRKANARRNAGRGILINSGRLSRSPRIINTAALRVDVGTDVPYAKAHNEGFTGVVTVKAHRRTTFGQVKVSTGKANKPYTTKRMATGSGEVKAHSRRMNLPQRKFMGNSPVIESILRKRAAVHIGRELKK